MKQIDDTTWVSGQIALGQVAALAQQGFTIIVNNRPDGEDPDQPTGAEIEAAARAAGIEYRHVPVASGLSQAQVEAMSDALQGSDGKALAFCRSGTRSTYLWALARRSAGEEAENIARKAAAAGYDLTPILPYLGAN